MSDENDKQGGTFGRRSAPNPPGAPVIHVYNRLVTERDVRRCMEDSGDLAKYEAGQITKSDAYRMTANWLRQLMEMS
jgi:hypothetical protein